MYKPELQIERKIDGFKHNYIINIPKYKVKPAKKTPHAQHLVSTCSSLLLASICHIP